MDKRFIYSTLLFLLIGVVFISPAFSGMECVGTTYNGVYYKKGEPYEAVRNGVKYNCVACGSCTPISGTQTPSTPSGGRSPSPNESIDEDEKIPEPDHARKAETLLRTAKMLEVQGQYDQAERLYKQALTYAERTNDPNVAIYRRNLTDFYRKREEERKRTEELRKRTEAEERVRQGQQLLSKMKGIGTGDKPKPHSFGGLKLEMKPLNMQKTYPAPSSAWEQALCAAYFSDMAKQAPSAEDARFYAAQAEIVMSGGATYIECMIPRVSNERVKKAQQIYESITLKTNDLQAVDAKLNETKEKIKEHEAKKKEATQKKEGAIKKVEELNAAAQSAKPEQKQEMDDLVSQAQKQLQDAETQLSQAEQGLNEAKQEEQRFSEQKDKLKDELDSLQNQMQETAKGGE